MLSVEPHHSFICRSDYFIDEATYVFHLDSQNPITVIYFGVQGEISNSSFFKSDKTNSILYFILVRKKFGIPVKNHKQIWRLGVLHSGLMNFLFSFQFVEFPVPKLHSSREQICFLLQILRSRKMCSNSAFLAVMASQWTIACLKKAFCIYSNSKL